MGFFSRLGDTLRNTFLNPVKDTLARTPLGVVANVLVPGVLDSRANIFANPAAPTLVAPPVAPVGFAPPGMVSIRREHLQALVTEARTAGRLRARNGALSARLGVTPMNTFNAGFDRDPIAPFTAAPILSFSQFVQSQRR